jgi:hypothetical protein
MELYDLLKYLIMAFDKIGIRYFLTGSIASMFYGEPRFTNDIDVVADVKREHIPLLIESFPSDKFYISEEAIMDAILHKYQFNIIHPASGLKVDVVIAKDDDYDKGRFNRLKKVSLAKEASAKMAAPEDVIIMKMRYYKEGGSEKHLRDIASMVKISGDEIDRDYIEYWTERFNLWDIWKAILDRIDKNSGGR